MEIGDITILNLNMLYLKYFDKTDREQHIPLGPLYLTRAKDFSRKLLASGLKVRWKAFGRINLIDREAMELMVKSGCVEIRYGIESGSEEVLERTVKGFDLEQAIGIVSESCGAHSPQVRSGEVPLHTQQNKILVSEHQIC